MPSPFFRISANGKDITSKLLGRGISLSITDGVGNESDTIALVIDDHDGSVQAPETGVVLSVEGGYTDGEQRNFGDFKVDQVTYSGYPQTISISAQSVDAKSDQKQQRVDQYPSDEFPTYGDIFAKVSGRMGLTLAIAGDIGGKTVSFEMQSEESDLSFATRIGRKLDASVTVKTGHLVVSKRGTGKSISGAELPRIAVVGGENLITYTVSRKDKPKHKEVKASWFDREKVEVKSLSVSAGNDGPTFEMRIPFQSESDARLGAEAQAKELVRGEGSASFVIDGLPSARGEALVRVFSVRDQVDGLWRSRTVTHSFSSSGPYTTSIECELPDGGAK